MVVEMGLRRACDRQLTGVVQTPDAGEGRAGEAVFDHGQARELGDGRGACQGIVPWFEITSA